MEWIADIHVHSKYSRATAKNLDLEHLAAAAQIKGITLVGTGDCTHPAWVGEIEEKLVPAEPGLFRLRPDIEAEVAETVPASCRGPVRFILQCEISNIYKKDGRTRKNHQVILLPDLTSTRAFNARLDGIGNIRSDGRPILGLDARNLLEILLEIQPEASLIPAHIWTPWFSVLGSKSGFDAVSDCFEDLTGEVFAVETGLSSDPPMNWRVSALDRFTLVSNSDAHSAYTLGRNANRFDTDLDYSSLRSALKDRDPSRSLGTLDLYPEEGKYHYDGHRKCGVRLHPAETLARGGICPECGKPVTVGVLNRVEVLADRPAGTRPETALPCRHIIPLPEILSELVGVGPKSKKVTTHYHGLLDALGPEMTILLNLPIDEIDRAGVPLLGEAIRRMRDEEVHLSPGYDGEYGRITLFDPTEMDTLRGQQTLFAGPGPARKPRTAPARQTVPVPRLFPEPGPASGSPPASIAEAPPPPVAPPADDDLLDGLNPDQRAAVTHDGGPLIIVAGPGAGKTLTLTRRIAWLIRREHVSPDRIIAVTFTNKAGREMRDRLAALLPGSPLPFVGTFHAFCLQTLREIRTPAPTVIDEEIRLALIREAIKQVAPSPPPVRAESAANWIAAAKQRLLTPDDDLSEIAATHGAVLADVYRAYQQSLEEEGGVDFEDLIAAIVRRLEDDPDFRDRLQRRCRHLFVDEYQDLNGAQYRLIQGLAGPAGSLCVIGDPDQAIYGFRGSDVRFFDRFENDFPGSRTVRLTRSYRSAETILSASHHVIRKTASDPGAARIYSGIEGIETLGVLELPSAKAEAVAVGRIIERMVGGTGFHSMDFGTIDLDGAEADRSFGDFAVFYRTHAQGEVIAEVLTRAGIPVEIARRSAVFDGAGIAEVLAALRLMAGRGRWRDIETLAGPDSGIDRKALAKLRQTSGEIHPASRITLETDLGTTALDPILTPLRDLAGTLGSSPVPEQLTRTAEALSLTPAIADDARRAETFRRLTDLAAPFGTDTGAFLDALALQTDPDAAADQSQRVSLMTLHAAKGLEFPVVFITGCEDGLIPYRRSETDPVDEAEERRLFYVGMTRAEEQLYLSWAKQRMIYGKTLDRQRSPFLADIEARLLRMERTAAKAPKAAEPVQLDLFGG